MEFHRIKLKPKTRSILQEWLFIIMAITGLMYFYYFITWWGIEPYLKQEVFKGYVSSGWAFLEIGIQGVIFGILFGVINLLFDSTRLGRNSFGAIITLKTLLYIVAAAISQMVVFSIYHIFGIFPREIMREMQSDISFSFMISMSVYFIFVILLINFILQINRKFGRGVLFSMITGKYHKPHMENRIFMFLDMRNSTGNAERLGHVQYSRLIQSCVHDLTDIVIRYKAQIYQYVGDEVVLTWPTAKGIKDLNCINLFVAYNQKLHDKASYYEKRFGTVPEFKAGVDEGTITVTEIGDLKRELAYHGEVLHTAARLEKLCNKVDKSLLLTNNLIKSLSSYNGYEMESIGEFELRGKAGKEEIYSIKDME